MKKVYLLALAALVGTTTMAQVDVTFLVNMNNETVSGNGVHVAGNWQAAAGYDADWDPGSAELTDDDLDGIYELTVSVPAGDYEYKFVNDNDWPGVESVPTVVQRGGGNDNRVFVVSDWHATDGLILPDVLFGGSAPEGELAVRLMIDMANQTVSEAGVHVAGNFVVPNWTPQYAQAFLSSGSKYAYIATVGTESTYAYKFLNGDDWGTDESVPEACAVDGNRSVTTTNEDLEMTAFCFGTCETCAPQTELTLRVNLNNEGGGNPDGVSVAGAFQGWSPGATLMTDDDMDGIYEVTLLLDQGSYQYKFVNGLTWDEGEAVPAGCAVDGNREVVVGEDPVTVTVCFNQCTEECAVDPDAADITFSVNMMNETVAAEGVWLMGGFTTPQWQAGAIQMSDDDADGIYTVTVEIDGSADVLYKYANGDPNSVEETGDFEAGGCGLSNGIGGFNRSHTRSGVAEALDVVCYDSCEDCVLTVSEIELGSVNIFPNPTTGIATISLENPNGYTLRMNIVDVTGKMVRENIILNSTNVEVDASNLNSGLYFLNIVNERSESATYKLMVK